MAFDLDVKGNDGDLLVRADSVAGVPIAENAVVLTHILGRRRLICCNFIAELLFHDFGRPSTIAQVARRRKAPVELIGAAVAILYAALLLKKADTDEDAAIRYGLDIDFPDPDLPIEQGIGRYPEHLFLESLEDSVRAASGADVRPRHADSTVDLDTPLQISSAVTAMRFGDNSCGVFTHFLEGPLLVKNDLWRLAMAFRNKATLRQAISSADLHDRDIGQIVLSCQFLIRRRILCLSRDEDIEAIRECVGVQIDLVKQRFASEKNITPASYQDPHFAWYQPYGYYDIDTIKPLRARGRVAVLGQCQSQFIAGALEFLAQRTGWHLETHGWFGVPEELGARDWSLIVLPTVAEAAAFYEAFAVGDLAACKRLVPEIVSEVNRNICLIREKTDAPVLVISVGESMLHGHRVASRTRHALKQVIAGLNSELMDSVASFEYVNLLDETSVLSKYPNTITLDDEYNAAPHHCGFDLWSWRDHPFEETSAVMPEKSESQIHPAFPLALACLEHLRHLYLSPRVKLIVFEPNGLLWPGVVDQRSRPYPKGINVYTGLDDFVYIGIHEALCAVRKRGIKLACVSSSATELLEGSLQYDSEARNLVRREDLVCALGSDDKKALLDQIVEATNIKEEEVLWIDQEYVPESGFEGHYYNEAIWKLRRYLLTEPSLNPFSEIADDQPQPVVAETREAGPIPERHEVNNILDTVLSEHLGCSDSALKSTDDLRLLGLDSFGCAELVIELERKLRFKLPDRDYVGSVLFSRRGLFSAIARALESVSTVEQTRSTSPDRWLESFTRESWCEQDVGSIISRHFENPAVGWILKFICSGNSFDYQYVTWGDLSGRALGYTRLFRKAGLKPGDTLTILLPQGLCLVAAVIGAILGGMVPSVSAFPGEKLTSHAFLGWFGELVHRSQTRCVVCTGELRALLEGELAANEPAVPIVTTVPEPVFDEPIFSASPDSPVLLQHSSGTTGIKKGVKLSHRALLAQIWDLSGELGCNDKDVIVSWLPYYHDMGLIACLMLPLLRSISTVIMSPFDWVRQPQILLHQISEERGTLCWLPNFAFLHCTNRIQAGQLAGLELSSLRAAINCSEPVTYDAMMAFYERFKQFGVRFSALSSSYAMAENAFAVTQTRAGRPAKTVKASSMIFARKGKVRKGSEQGNTDVSRFVSSGSVLPGARVRIVGQGTVLDEGEVGEIQVQSDYLFSGYHNDEESTRDAFDADWYQTGDLGFLLEGELYVTGRRKDLIIVAGHNVYPHDIESEIGSLPGIKPGRAVAFGIYDDSEGTEKLVLMAEIDTESLSGETGPDEDALKTAMRDTVLSRFFVNVSDIRLFPTETLRKSTSGKLARGANRELYLDMNNERE
jgi:fatty-acyl-CoA synthase